MNANRESIISSYSRYPLEHYAALVGDADALHAEWVPARAGGQLEPLSDIDYGLREGRYVDPDGNVIRYGSPVQ
jgi:hypothetical protein